MTMTRSRISSTAPYLALIAVVLVVDQLSKAWAGAYWAAHGQTTFNRLFTLYVVHNTGIGFGLLPGSGVIVGWLTVAFVVLLTAWMVRVPRSQWLVRLGLALLIGGALGNMVDRIWAGQVLDFILTPLWPRILNIADIAIRGGAVMVLAGSVLRER